MVIRKNVGESGKSLSEYMSEFEDHFKKLESKEDDKIWKVKFLKKASV